MTTQSAAERNVSIFIERFWELGNDGGSEFEKWLGQLLHEGDPYPFVMSAYDDYDFDDLIVDLLTHCPEQSSLIAGALIKQCQPVRYSRRLDILSQIAYACARARATEVAGDIAAALEGYIDTVSHVLLTREQKADAAIELDRIVASLGGLALETAEARVIMACRRIFYDDEFALFAPSLFAPLARHYPGEIVQLWARLVQAAHTPMKSLSLDPVQGQFVSVTIGGNRVKSHFSIDNVFEEYVRHTFSTGGSIASLVRSILNIDISTIDADPFLVAARRHLLGTLASVMRVSGDPAMDSQLVLFVSRPWAFFAADRGQDLRLKVTIDLAEYSKIGASHNIVFGDSSWGVPTAPDPATTTRGERLRANGRAYRPRSGGLNPRVRTKASEIITWGSNFGRNYSGRFAQAGGQQ